MCLIVLKCAIFKSHTLSRTIIPFTDYMCYKDAFTLLFRIVVIYLFIIFLFLFLKECIKLIKSIILIQKNIYIEFVIHQTILKKVSFHNN